MKKLGRDFDGRYKLTPEEDERLMKEIGEGKLNDQELALKYGVSRSKVYFMRRPDQKKKKQEKAKKYQKEKQKWKDEQHYEAQKKYRLKKKELAKRDMI